MKNNIPSVDPANNDTLVGTFNFVLQKYLQTCDDMLPAKVIAVKPGSPTFVQVQPQILVLGTGGDQLPRAQIASIPVLSLGGGGFVMTFPVKPGDMGYIKANDRDISLFMQNFNANPPNTERMHSFSDAIFIPNTFTGYTADPDNLVIQSLAGDVKISVGSDTIDIIAPNINIDGADVVNINSSVEINVTAPDVNINSSSTVEITADDINIVADDVSIEGSGSVDITAPTTNINGNLFVDGNIVATGTITP